MIETAEIKPCPFCAATELHVGRGAVVWVVCWNCGACGPQMNADWQAVDAWNKAPREDAIGG